MVKINNAGISKITPSLLDRFFLHDESAGFNTGYATVGSLQRLMGTGYLYMRDSGGSLSAAIQADFTDGKLIVGSLIRVQQHRSDQPGMPVDYVVRQSASGTDDGGQFIDFAGFQLEALFDGAVPLSAYGCSEALSNNEVQANKALTVAGSLGLAAVCDGMYPTTGTVLVPSYVHLAGRSRHFTGFKASGDYHIVTSFNYADDVGQNEYAIADVAVGVDITDLRVEGPTPSGAYLNQPPAPGSGVGIGVYGRRCRVNRVDVLYTGGDGIDFELGSDGGIEYDTDHQHIVKDVFVRKTGGKGIHWKCLDSVLDEIYVSFTRGIGVHVDASSGVFNGASDGKFWHIYSTGYGATGAGDGGPAVQCDGRMQLGMLQLDGAFGEGLVVNTSDCMFGQVYAFLGHRAKREAATTTATDTHIEINAACQIGLLRVKAQGGGRGLHVTNNRVHVDQLDVDGRTEAGASTAIGVGVDWDGDYGYVGKGRVFGWAGAGGIGVRVGDSGSLIHTDLTMSVTSCTTNWDGDLSGLTNRYDIVTDDGPRVGSSRSFIIAEYTGILAAAPNQPWAWGAAADATARAALDGFVAPTYMEIESIGVLFGTVGAGATADWQLYKNAALVTGVDFYTPTGTLLGSDTFTTNTEKTSVNVVPPLSLAPNDQIDLRCVARTNSLTNGRLTLGVRS